MSRIEWDALGERTYELGLDRGVLYVGAIGVPWNGLVSMDEQSASYAKNQVFLDGVKITNRVGSREFAAKLQAFTFPDEFIECEGYQEYNNGSYLDEQTPRPFGLSYRTTQGDDIQGQKAGYKVHLVYNASAINSPRVNQTMNASMTPLLFSWDITTRPIMVAGYKPLSHVILDSLKMPKDALQAIEDILYGYGSFSPRLPSLEELLVYLNSDFGTISRNTVTGLNRFYTPGTDLYGNPTEGFYKTVIRSRLRDGNSDGLYVWY